MRYIHSLAYVARKAPARSPGFLPSSLCILSRRASIGPPKQAQHRPPIHLRFFHRSSHRHDLLYLLQKQLQPFTISRAWGINTVSGLRRAHVPQVGCSKRCDTATMGHIRHDDHIALFSDHLVGTSVYRDAHLFLER